MEPPCALLLLAALTWHTGRGACPADGRVWVPFKSSCYHFVHGEEDKAKSYTLEEAKDFCQQHGLLQIASAEENQFIVDYSPHVWKTNINVWLGMFYDTDVSGFKWFDNSTVRYDNWEDKSEALADPIVDSCAALHLSTGQWVAVSCSDDPEHGVVCQTAAQSEATGKSKGSPLVSALVILCVVAVLGVSAVLWFLHQKNHLNSSLFTSFEYHPPFRSPRPDQTCLVEDQDANELS
ncbi:CD302 antigen [Denticeps clupeoides]|uniref:C-type lectin domain-containing protein n=1 Tax=Denticeps clupeoides TaxID=299321 RepID=A0AAY4C3I0_9TELE|nr:CD302 antigen [Denticeps clupeoides]